MLCIEVHMPCLGSHTFGGLLMMGWWDLCGSEVKVKPLSRTVAWIGHFYKLRLRLVTFGLHNHLVIQFYCKDITWDIQCKDKSWEGGSIKGVWKDWKGGHLILSGCEKPPIVSSSSRCYVVVNIRVSPISNTYHWWSYMCTLKEDIYVTSVGVCHLSYTIVNGMLSWWHNNNILGSNHIVTTHKNIETSKTIETKYQNCPREANIKNQPERITWKIVPPW